MKLIKHFASFLYFAISFIFIVSVAYFILGISAKIFGDDGQYIYKIGHGTTFTIGNKNSEGALVPVALTLQIPDFIQMNKSYFSAISEDTYPSTNNEYLKENKKIKARNLYTIMSTENSTFTIQNGNYIHQKPSTFKFIKYVHDGNSQYLKIKTTSTFTNIVLTLRELLNSLFYMFEMYFLALILKEAAKEIYFSEVLSKYISKLGYLLLFSQLVPLIYTFIDLKLFGLIMVKPQILASLQNTYFENIQVSFNPTINVDIYIVLLGSVLVLLTKLVERGRKLEEENEFIV